MLSILTTRLTEQFSKCNCEKPQKVQIRSGETIIVPCGQCPLCLQKRRANWSFRLVEESRHPRCVHAFGATLTYDNAHLPWLRKSTLDTISQLDVDIQRDELSDFYEFPNKSHSYLKVERGVSNEMMKETDDPCIGLLNSRDIDRYIRSIRKSFETEYPKYFFRYFIAGEYGDTDTRTHRPHYHGIFFVFSKTDEIDVEDVANHKDEWEHLILDKWRHSVQKWDNKKGIYYGKSIQVFGAQWGDYLGKYVNKAETSTFAGCYGALYVPERIWFSRENKKYGLGSLGMGFLTNERIFNYNRQLYYSEKTGAQFNCTYQENGFTKSLPLAYKRAIIQRYFDFKFSRLQKWISFTKNCPASLPEVYVHPSQVRKRASLCCFPPDRNKIYKWEFTREETENFERYLRWQATQVECYIRLTCHSLDNSLELQTKTDGVKLIDYKPSYWAFECREARDKILARVNETRQMAIEKKHAHAKKNGYI